MVRRTKIKPISKKKRRETLGKIISEFNCEVDKLKYKYGMRDINPKPKEIILSPNQDYALVVLNVSQRFITNVNDIANGMGADVEYAVRNGEAIFMYNTKNTEISFVGSIMRNKILKSFTRKSYETPTIVGKMVPPQKDGIIIGSKIKEVIGCGNQKTNELTVIVRLSKGAEIEFSGITLD